ncbi:MAG: carboxypeptidase regulatory-like domain-containing protein, partial [Rhodothermales bacterium]|nr:carboxypeptidase regulatory-like domain-containing protein [Rhodothermales bacterium]
MPPRFCVVLAGLVLLCSIMAGACARPAQAQAPPPSLAELLSYRPLGEALVAWQSATGIDLSYDPGLVAGRRTRGIEPAAETPEALLRALLAGSGLVFYRLTSGAYAIRTEAEVAALRGSLSGYVFNRETGRPLPDAHVVLRSDAVPNARGAAADALGLFHFEALTPGRYEAHVTHVGYAGRVVAVVVRPETRTEVVVELRVRPGVIEPVVVESFLERPGVDASDRVLRPAEQVEAAGLGMSDAVRGLNNLIGVRVGDALAEVHIQGGEAGEHQFRLDGTPIFEPVHLRGLLGAFNPFALSRITAHKAGFSVSEGSYLAGVIEAEHALADTDGHPFDVQVDPLSVNGRIQLEFGAPDAVHGQAMAAARSSTWTWGVYRPSHIERLLTEWNTPDEFLLRASLLAAREAGASLDYDALVQQLDSLPPSRLPDLGFRDVHLAGRLRLRPGTSLYTSYYRGDNRLDSRRLATAFDTTAQEQNPDRYDWFNENAQVQARTVLGSRAFVTARLRSSIYDLRHDYSALSDSSESAFTLPGQGTRTVKIDLRPADDGNRIRETALEATLDGVHRGGAVQLGAEAVRTAHRFSINDVFTRSIDHDEAGWRMALFAEEALRLGPATLTGGLRLTYLGTSRRVYAEPRLEARYEGGGVAARLAGGLYRQFVNQFDISSISPSALFPSVRFWMPLDGTIAPPKAYHLAADAAWQPAPAWVLRLESYYKHQPHLLRIDYPALWRRDFEPVLGGLPITSQADFLEASRGRAFGAAAAAERATGPLRAAARYEFSRA